MTELRIAPDLLAKLAEKLLKVEPTLWMSAMGIKMADLRQAAADEASLQSLMMNLMKPPSRHYRRKMLAHLCHHDDPEVHPLARHVYASCGIDVVPVAMLGNLLMDPVRFLDQEGLEIMQSPPFTGEKLHSVTISFRDDLVWEHDGDDHSLIIGGDIPDTVINTLMGKPLRCVFDHSALHGMDAEIVGMDTGKPGKISYLEVRLGPPVIGRPERQTARR